VDVRGYRNLAIGICYLGVCTVMGYWSPESIDSLGGTFGSLGLGTTGVIAGRAANKWAENGQPE
jgi:hypothetical protein